MKAEHRRYALNVPMMLFTMIYSGILWMNSMHLIIWTQRTVLPMWPMISPTHFVFGFSIKRFFVIIMFKVVNRIKVYEIDMDERSFLWKKSLKEKLIP